MLQYISLKEKRKKKIARLNNTMFKICTSMNHQLCQ